MNSFFDKHLISLISIYALTSIMYVYYALVNHRHNSKKSKGNCHHKSFNKEMLDNTLADSVFWPFLLAYSVIYKVSAQFKLLQQKIVNWVNAQ